MSRSIDYSKWNKIEISDDEDDTHPNVDTPSLFRWRHQARMERMEQDKKEKDDFKSSYSKYQSKLTDVKQALKEAEEKAAVDELAKLKLEVSEMEKQEAKWKKKENELVQKEKSTPWNVDTICHEGKSRTLINKDKPVVEQELTDDERLEKQEKFTMKNESLIKKFGMFRRNEDSQTYLTDHPELVCEETANYLVIWCINLEVEEKHDLMNHVAHQCIVMQFILELAKTLKVDPRKCVSAFFSRIKLAEKQYLDAFEDELTSFKERIKGRAAARLEAAMKQVEEEERQNRLGPGGLDPVEVFETLPKVLQDCFESKDISKLQEAILQLPREDAEYHMKRCIDSGMWVPNANDNPQPTKDQENVYQEPGP